MFVICPKCNAKSKIEVISANSWRLSFNNDVHRKCEEMKEKMARSKSIEIECMSLTREAQSVFAKLKA